MLEIKIPPTEAWDESTQQFIVMDKEQTIRLEHSLVSVSKWESKWKKPFLSRTEKTPEETLDYIRCMTITPNVDPNVYNLIDSASMNKIEKYIESPMTATTFSKQQGQPGSREVITSEIIYYWMISLEIPFECQKWHLNRLLTLIKVCNLKNQPGKKMSRKDIMSRNTALNQQRRQRMNSKG